MKMFECECCEELYSDDRMMSSEKNICVYCWEVLEEMKRMLFHGGQNTLEGVLA